MYGYEYVDVEDKGCEPCCGCAIDIYDETNLNGWGDYRPLKKPEKQQNDYEIKDVLNAFNQRYGKGTLVHPSMLNYFDDKKVIKLEEVDNYLGLNKKSPSPPMYQEEREPKDPQGWDYVGVKDLKKWKENNSPRDWLQLNRDDDRGVFLGNMESHSKFHN